MHDVLLLLIRIRSPLPPLGVLEVDEQAQRGKPQPAFFLMRSNKGSRKLDDPQTTRASS